jgi:sugar/nucleoside kinase (ribokinase family)
LRIGIASNVVLDTIKDAKGDINESAGGPPCYCGITSRRFGFDVELATRVGRDLPTELRNYLLESKISIKDDQVVGEPTTRFRLEAEGDSRRLMLHSKCAQLTADEINAMKVDCWLVSPVIDEVPSSVLNAIKQDKDKKRFVILDPQGYMRLVDDHGLITLKERLDLDLSGLNAIKVDAQEMAALTAGSQGLEGMKSLQSRGIEFVISTEDRIVHMLHEKTHYWIKIKEVETPDSTGVGDILTAAFCCAYMKEKDPLWALCFGAGALRAALETKEIGLAKIPSMSKIEQSTSYFYNTVSFKQLS